MRAILIDVDKEEHYAVRRVFKPADMPRDHDTLRWMYREMNCSAVEVVALAPDLHMWVDEEGMYRSPINLLATHIARTYGFVFQPYYGNVMFLGGADRKGDTLGLSEEMADRLVDQIRQFTG